MVTMSDDSKPMAPTALTAADDNMFEVWERIAALGPAPGRDDLDGVVALRSGIPVALFNPAFARGELRDPAASVERVSRTYAAAGLPFALVFRDEVAPGLADACAAAGLVEHWQMPLMMIEPIPSLEDRLRPQPAGLQIRAVDASNIDEYGDVLADGFGMPRDLVAAVLGPDLVDAPGFVGLLGYLDGAPVSTSAAYLSADTCGVYNVCTVAAARGEGIGEALTWAAADVGREAGSVRSILQSSEQGESVYARMGYVTRARYRQFEPRAD
jgi:hypothetical protein